MPPSAHPAALDSLLVVPGVRWYHLADPFSPTLDAAATHFGIHHLQVEDCRHRRQMARLEEHDAYTFLIIKALENPDSAAPGDAEAAESPGDSNDPPATPVRTRFEDFDIFIGSDYVLTVSEGASNLVGLVAPRVAAETRLHSPDRIAHALVDTAVDQYLPALDALGEFINRLEDRVIHRPSPATLREIFGVKRELLEFRRVATSMREAVNALVRRYDSLSGAPGGADRDLRLYYRDIYDHIVRVVEFVETYRDLLTGSLDIYLSAVANRTNEVMKILTLWGTVALPLLILTSFYGMNVKLPFQEHPHVLLILTAFMVLSVAGVLYYFRRKNWF